MAEDTPKQTPQQELKEKLKQTRTTFTHAKKLLLEIETSYNKFLTLRDTLNDKNNGVKANQDWMDARKDDIAGILTTASTKLTELETAASSVTTSVEDISTKYTTFKGLSDQVFDKNDGLAAVLKTTRRLKKTTDTLAGKISENSGTADTKLTEITKTAENVAQAYDDFVEKKNRIDDEENGFEAQLRRATEYADSIQDTKTKSESALVSITKFKDQGDELVGQIKDSKKAVDDYKNESETLTADIRNTLNKATQFTLSEALKDRANSYKNQMYFWAVLQAIAVIALTIAVYLIFDALFLSGTREQNLERLQDGPTLMSVVSKFLFTTPLIFAVYYTTSNYRHAQYLRDRYAWKETVAKNFQNYIKLLKDEFKDEGYDEERFNFSIETTRSIYSEPNASPKKKKYNFSFYNRIVEANIEEEDLRGLQSVVADKIKKIAKKIAQTPPESEPADSEPEVSEKPIEKASSTEPQPPISPKTKTPKK